MTVGKRVLASSFPLPGPSFSSYPSTPMTSSSVYFDKKLCYATSKRDPKLRRQHPVEVYSILVPMEDTPASPPPEDRQQNGPDRAEQGGRRIVMGRSVQDPAISEVGVRLSETGSCTKRTRLLGGVVTSATTAAELHVV